MLARYHLLKGQLRLCRYLARNVSIEQNFNVAKSLQFILCTKSRSSRSSSCSDLSEQNGGPNEQHCHPRTASKTANIRDKCFILFFKVDRFVLKNVFFCFFAAQLIISLINRDPQIYQTLWRDLIAPDKTTFNCTYSSSNQLHLTQRQYNAAYTLLLQY